MAIALKLADATTPLYPAPQYAPLDYAGIDIDTAPPRTRLRIARDIIFAVGMYVVVMVRTVPVVLRILALAVIAMAYVLIAIGRVLHWLVTGGPQMAERAIQIAAKPVTVPVAAYQRSRIPFAEIA